MRKEPTQLTGHGLRNRTGILVADLPGYLSKEWSRLDILFLFFFASTLLWTWHDLTQVLRAAMTCKTVS